MKPTFDRALSRMAVVSTAAFLWLAAVCGCSDSRQTLAFEVNGYACTTSEFKFYTDKSVFATRCPVHHDENFSEVVAHMYADGDVVLGPRSASIPRHPLGKRYAGWRFPTEKELLAWGAVKKSKEDVGQ